MLRETPGPASRSSLHAWWAASEQTMLRAEARWLLRWMTRPPGLLWIVALAALQFLSLAMTWSMARRAVLGMENMRGWGWFSLLSGAQVLIYFGLWIYMIRTRSLAPFRPGRIQDLMLAPLDRRMLWPGLLAAPILFSAAMTGAAGLMSVVTSLTIGVPDVMWLWFADPGYPQPAMIALPFSPVLAALQLIAGLAYTLAITAYAVLRSLPNGGLLRLLIAILLASLAITVPASGYFTGHATTPADFEFLLRTQAVLSGLIAVIIWLGCLRALRGDKVWRKLGKAAEAQR